MRVMGSLCIIKEREGLGQNAGQRAERARLSHLSPVGAVNKAGTFATHTLWGHGLTEIGKASSQSLCGR